MLEKIAPVYSLIRLFVDAFMRLYVDTFIRCWFIRLNASTLQRNPSQRLNEIRLNEIRLNEIRFKGTAFLYYKERIGGLFSYLRCGCIKCMME